MGKFGPGLRLPSFIVACALVFIVSAAFGPAIIGRIHHAFATTTAPFTDKGWFVVANSYPANGSSAPRALVAGTWGDMLNFTQPANVTIAFYESYGLVGQDLDFKVNASIPKPMMVYVELGNNLQTPCYLDVAWA